MTRERGSRAESKNCQILLFQTPDRRFDTKVKCPTRRASFWVKFPAVGSLTRVKCPGIARKGGWAVLELPGTLSSSFVRWIIIRGRLLQIVWGFLEKNRKRNMVGELAKNGQVQVQFICLFSSYV